MFLLYFSAKGILYGHFCDYFISIFSWVSKLLEIWYSVFYSITYSFPRVEIFRCHHFRCMPQQLLSKCLVVLLFIQATGQASDLEECWRAFLKFQTWCFPCGDKLFVNNPLGWIEPFGLFFLIPALIMKSVVLTKRQRSITSPGCKPTHFSSKSKGSEIRSPALRCYSWIIAVTRRSDNINNLVAFDEGVAEPANDTKYCYCR